MRVVELIERKREGGRLRDDEITELIAAFTRDEVPDYQMSALCMAIVFRGLDDGELAAWTDAMIDSGETLDLSSVPGPKIDKHSTGGVGDKVSIPLAPMVGACGVVVPMMSGRGLGHTGGTLDKLESIPGFTTGFDRERFTALLEKTGVVLAGQSDRLVPADRRLYALRDASGTVPSIPLIASSIMSKKLAEDLDGLVLDVKVGNGAFMKDVDGARRLATTMAFIGAAHDTPVVAILSDMSQPLGREVGNANEIAESIEVLRGDGPADLTELVHRLGEDMLLMGGLTGTRAEARSALKEVVADGSALETFASVIEAQGGDPGLIDEPSRLPQPPEEHIISAPRDGYVVECHALRIGLAATRLGAGRATKEDDVDHRVGITVLAKRGDEVEQGQPIARVGWADRGRLEDALELLEEAWLIDDEPPADPPSLIIDVISGDL